MAKIIKMYYEASLSDLIQALCVDIPDGFEVSDVQPDFDQDPPMVQILIELLES